MTKTPATGVPSFIPMLDKVGHEEWEGREYNLVHTRFIVVINRTHHQRIQGIQLSSVNLQLWLGKNERLHTLSPSKTLFSSPKNAFLALLCHNSLLQVRYRSPRRDAAGERRRDLRMSLSTSCRYDLPVLCSYSSP